LTAAAHHFNNVHFMPGFFPTTISHDLPSFTHHIPNPSLPLRLGIPPAAQCLAPFQIPKDLLQRLPLAVPPKQLGHCASTPADFMWENGEN
jgi:hypothetical protein